MINDAIKQLAGYKYYKLKKDKSEKGNAEEEPEEQHMFPVRSGRGKVYMFSGDQVVNVPSKPKKAVVPKKPRTITIANNLFEQDAVVVKLKKSVSIEEQQQQQRQIMTQLTIESQVEKDVEYTHASERGLKLKGVSTEDPTIQSLLDL
ncbi:hypothetical protein Tco_1414075 [Tanacetum coccineum]